MIGKTFTTMLGGRELSIETGKLAKLVSGSVTVRYGDTLLLVTAQASDTQSKLDFLPLTVEFEERHYAVGKIPGSFQRREGRPGEKAILSARITDRQIRPLFPKGYRHETQVIITVLSADGQNAPDVLGPIGAAAALSISDIPWAGPTACVRVGQIDGQYVVNPTTEQLTRSRMDLVVAGTREAVMMVECGAQTVSEDDLVGAIEFAHAEMQGVIALIEQMRAEVGHEKFNFLAEEGPANDYVPELTEKAKAAGLRDALLTHGKKDRSARLKALRNGLIEGYVPDPTAEGSAELTQALKDAFGKVEKRELRRLILEENLRADGRDSKTVRPIWIEARPLPTAHGSAVFTRGETQVLGVTTLGTERDEILIDDLTAESGDKFLLHYNFPPYSTGEVKRMGGQSRREIGHGNLAKRAIRAVLPSFEEFPYVIRVVGDVLESNGSSSMGTVCAGTLSLMDAGVPLKAPVAGVAMGLVMEGDNYRVLTDILGLEDALGDMDFKVCGTAEGVTALQMDIKVGGITPQIMREALAQAKEGRLHILGKMAEVLAAPRAELSPTAPHILSLKINPELIGKVIGPGGKQVRELEAMGAQVTIEEDGTVRIFSASGESAEAVKARIEAVTKEAKVGEEFEGTVVKIAPFGAFVNLFPGQDGMLHISQLSEQRVENVEDVLTVGDKLKVKIANIDDRGKIDLIRPELEGKVPLREPRAPRGGDRGPRRDSDRGGDRGPRREFSDRGPRPEGARSERPEGQRTERPATAPATQESSQSSDAPAAPVFPRRED
ncbi:polyribonucleotide nucleotidyltransferase [Deinococcus radiodurans]|jgi:polyribonucleotide nucleotidyltransferase|uniref:Polyribonucleotide nucleotidyltransferase n=1 Tax=Deinococcus radiodurans (strain ATCC 13939 / DSM 20539 / JCM 16871 / CCUG 27074 / LMG 4051 / NBRC 15346 / NCIMB 9279 / VKM B-1422 / R1) TaxID=243230 RepID=PNP_DEIRA|nr:polyribonucleotide nucleotidyltransferase [Deinococcus radiodurans]Q9RSR1.2 RecName: Full=Polyribonucleotide nucleotidyltransferase; AltName: Full=Polynucleotide phosphorylase; Short=PNPase [Deinococcus radiodurans R1 = ATCC 13939 = DSM 20539]ANC70867.1 polyribonucleotide nucleotidyltransferase [Deinococcus radiodurans R1 = ATCC 13939 = DSM 20539]QIP29987.1 polyribonucleotide nucleotidyltransferase [Deinococcus radiodurans]QIP31339.1 polyribonucleotide nucleotidyltransferase [Deinococcus rad